MIIAEPQRTTTEKSVQVSVSVTLETPFSLLPKKFTLWYEVPSQYEEALTTDRGDAFTVGLLFLAMRLHEDIHVRAPMSSRLLHGLREYQQIFSEWFSYLQAVEIKHEGFATPIQGATGTGTFFSGGVDSFFTLWSHLQDQEAIPDYKITHGIFIDGFDTNRPGSSAFDTFFEAYERLFDTLGLTLIPVRTNLKTYINNTTVGWRVSHGSFLISTSLLLQYLLDICYVPSTEEYTDDAGFKYGTNPLVDHLLSTESLEIVHDGAWANRPDKTRVIADWPITYDHLYVCFGSNDPSIKNCCRCEKCIRTMIALELVDRLDQYSTFPQHLDRSYIRGWEIPHFNVSGAFAEQLKEQAVRMGRTRIANDLRYVIWKHRLRHSAVGRFFRKLIVEPAKRSEWISNLYHRLKA